MAAVASKGKQELTQGSYGPYQLSWSKSAKVWLLTANTEREVLWFRIGSEVRGRNGLAKAFGSDDDIKRCLRFLKSLDRRMQAAQTVSLPELDGLGMAVMDDGMIRVDGEHLGLYLDLSNWEFPRGVSRRYEGVLFLPADHKCIPLFIAAMQATEEAVKAYLTRPLPARASELRWCEGERDSRGALIYRGRLIVADAEAVPGTPTLGVLPVPFDQEEVWTQALLDRERDLQMVLESDTFPAFRSGLDAKLAELSALDVRYGQIPLTIDRDGPWLMLSLPDGLVKPAWLRQSGWCYSAAEGLWVVNATRYTLDAVSEALEALMGRVKGYSSAAGYVDPLADLDGLFPAPEPVTDLVDAPADPAEPESSDPVQMAKPGRVVPKIVMAALAYSVFASAVLVFAFKTLADGMSLWGYSFWVGVYFLGFAGLFHVLWGKLNEAGLLGRPDKDEIPS